MNAAPTSAAALTHGKCAVLDLARIKARAADRLAAAAPPAAAPPAPVATLANPANWLTPAPPISQLATLASNDARTLPGPEDSPRTRLFCRRGLDEADAQRLALLLIRRDDTQDHRCVCLECARLSGTQGRGWVCTVPKLAQVARELPAVLVTMLQACPGFKPAAL